ncbi:hypothetical protein [Paenarthrobacter sp. PH39-S1]|uniref:hypothetical protein n=1 Tax=Paenarthrobacter sp. PH39-S1 TaxID=3046204 RepID=UPI0024BBA43A|nr:hypothetical protein [Paenarthrobacter sp. PH39-S1]MDJ0355311.1 hypothetical protein [Paenarthrobacter sp. PH39-S1]
MIDRQPGLVDIDTVAHCGNTAKGRYAFTLTVTDPFTGWTVNQAIKNKSAKWVAQALAEIHNQVPYPIDHLHSDYAEKNAKLRNLAAGPCHAGNRDSFLGLAFPGYRRV